MSTQSTRLTTEVAHVLFLDIVGFSRRSMEEQTRVTDELRRLVRGTPEYGRALGVQTVIGLDTGDGMALVFFRDPLSPVQCAVEIARALHGHRALQVRMGIHSGPVSRVEDLNGRENVAGSGINTAQRVMDCGDPGHILLSSASAEVIREFETWASSLHDLGECEVKHGQRLHLYNLVVGEVGRADVPSRATFVKPPPDVADMVAHQFRRLAHGISPTLAGGIAAVRSIIQAPASPTLPITSVPAPGQTRVALLYKRGQAADEHVLRILEAGLKEHGDAVFIDRHLQIGVAWAQEIERRIREADAVVVLVSEASLLSEMLEYEVQTAHQAAQAQGGKPRILPVRVAFTGPLTEPLGAILSPLQYALWRGEADDTQVVADVIRTLHAPPPPPAPPRRETIGGAVPLDSEFYIVRPTDDEFFEAIARQDSIVLVKGARQMGKTSLLARGLQQARGTGARVVFTDFQTPSPSILSSAETLFLWLAEMLVDQLDLDVDPRKGWNADLGANTNLERFVRRQVLGSLREPLVWGLDEVDRLFPPACSFGSEVFGLFRSWHNRRSLDPTGPWSRLTLAIAYATEAHLFITDLNQSPFNVGTRLALDDFDQGQVADLNERYGRPLTDRDSVVRLYGLIGGQPYLVRRALDELCRRDITLQDIEQDAVRDEGIFGDHLRRIFITLSQDAELTDVVRGLLAGKACPTVESFYRLRTAGLVAGETAEGARFRCRLYETYLRRHLA